MEDTRCNFCGFDPCSCLEAPTFEDITEKEIESVLQFLTEE